MIFVYISIKLIVIKTILTFSEREFLISILFKSIEWTDFLVRFYKFIYI